MSSAGKACFAIAFFVFGTAMIPGIAFAQETAGAPTEEIVVNLASGRVVIAVVKDAILIGTVETPIEPQTHVPTPVELGSERAGILLGAVDWFSPSTQKTLARLDSELPHLHSDTPVQQAGPHLAQSQGGDEAADIEVIGQNLLERLNELAARNPRQIGYARQRAHRAVDHRRFSFELRRRSLDRNLYDEANSTARRFLGYQRVAARLLAILSAGERTTAHADGIYLSESRVPRLLCFRCCKTETRGLQKLRRPIRRWQRWLPDS